MQKRTRSVAVGHAKSCFPRESCGLVIVSKGKERYWPCRNLALGTDQFVIDPHDYAKANDRGEVTAIVHSHPNLPATPSQADRVACEATRLPWHIVSLPSEAWEAIVPSGYEAPIVGRQWCHGVLDCYSLIRDWFKRERHLDLPDFDRFDEWWLRGENLYLDNFKAVGFDVIDPSVMTKGDCLLMQIGSPVPNHAALYTGDGQIVHHLQGRLSSRDVYGGYWQKVTTHTVRHKDMVL